MDRFLGIGLKKAIALWFFFIMLTVMAKVIFTKYHVSGLSEIFQAV